MQNHKENKCKPDVCLHVDLFCVSAGVDEW